MPSLVYVLMRHGQTFEEGVLRAVNDTHDNDTIGAIAERCWCACTEKKRFRSAGSRTCRAARAGAMTGQVYRLIEAARQSI